MSQLLLDTEGFPWSNFTASGRHSVVLPSSSSVFLAGSKCKLLIRNFMQPFPRKANLCAEAQGEQHLLLKKLCCKLW